MIKGAKKYPHQDGPMKGLPTVLHTNMIMYSLNLKVIKLSKNLMLD